MTLTVRIGSLDVRCSSTERPGWITAQSYRAGTGQPLGGLRTIPLGEVTAEPLRVVSGDLASFREAGIDYDADAEAVDWRLREVQS